MKIVYSAFDGRIFNTEEECRQYEADFNEEILGSVRTLKNFCAQFDSCGDCPFWTGTDMGRDCMFCHNTPIEWDVDEIFN